MTSLNLFELEREDRPTTPVLLPTVVFRHGEQRDFGTTEDPIDTTTDAQQPIVEDPDEDAEPEPLPPVTYPKNADFETEEPDIIIGPDGRPPRKRERHQRTSDHDIVVALRKCGGFRTQAARMLGITYEGLRKRIKARPELQEAERLVNETGLDLAESKLMHAVRQGAPWAIKFFLEHKGASRDYAPIEEERESETDFEFVFCPDQIVDESDEPQQP